jgi:hypothetical protein
MESPPPQGMGISGNEIEEANTSDSEYPNNHEESGNKCRPKWI